MNGGSRKTSYLNHFASADTIVPDPTNPQAYNRYSYVYNNPIRFNDPSGHCGADTGDDADDLTEECERIESELETKYGIDISYGLTQRLQWTHEEMILLEKSIQNMAAKMDDMSFLDGLTIKRRRWRESSWQGYDATYDQGDNQIDFYNNTFNDSDDTAQWIILHEMGHAFDNHIGRAGTEQAQHLIYNHMTVTNCNYFNLCDFDMHSFSQYPGSSSGYDTTRVNMWSEFFAQAFALTMYTGSYTTLAKDTEAPLLAPISSRRNEIDEAINFIETLVVAP